MVKEKWNIINKSKIDDRDYRIVECNNELKAILVSDPKTDKAAAAMTVGVGSSADPENLQGLAHFLEHMLFLGSQKFPMENEYKKFLIEHGGSANASTSLDKTTFYLTVSPEHLEEAMDRFSQFFIDPLLSPEATDREVNSISMECERNRNIDRRRLMRLERWLCKTGHPYQKFSTGNKKLLDTEPRSKGINVRNELLNFHDKWYSANLMTLAVVGSDNLDDLEDKVQVFFSNIKNKSVTPFHFSEHPYQKNETAIIYYTSPIKNRTSLTLMFPCPDFSEHYTSGPVVYLKYILECRSKGSLYSVLRNNFWIDGKIEAGLQVITNNIGKFFIRLKVTEDGLSNHEDVITLVFQYIQMIRANGPLYRIFEDCAKIAEINFEFKEKVLPEDLAINLSEKRSNIKYEDVLVSDYKLTDWNPNIITDLLSYLKPNNVRIRLVSRKYESGLREEDPVYGVKYRIERIGASLLNLWNDTDVVRKDFTLPSPNKMIPTDFGLVGRDYPIGTKPAVVFESKLSRLWYMIDSCYFLPKVFYIMNFYCPTTYDSPFASNLTFLMLSRMEDVFREEHWHAEVTGMFLKIQKTNFGFQFFISGFSQRILQYVESVLTACSTLQFNAQDLALRKDFLRRLLTNKQYDTPPTQSDYLLHLIINDTKWMMEELVECIDNITITSVETFYNRVLEVSFCEGFIYGNILKKDAVESWARHRDCLPRNTLTLSVNQMRPGREIELPLGTNLLHQISEHVHTSSCTTVYFHLGTYSLHTAAVAQLFHQYIKEPVFSVLRTKEQLAYSVFRGIDRTTNCLGLYIRLLTDKHPRHVDDRIEKLLTILGTNLQFLSNEEIETHKQSLIADKRVVSKNMSSRLEELWDEIGNRYYCFDRKDKEVAIIQNLTTDNLIEFYDTYIKPQAPKRRRLSIFVHSLAGEYPSSYVEDNQQSLTYVTIDDIIQFKNSCSAFPLCYVTNPRLLSIDN